MLNSRRDYLKKSMFIVRLLSLLTAQRAIVKRLGKKRERRSDDFGFDLDALVLAGMVLLVKLLFQRSGDISG